MAKAFVVLLAMGPLDCANVPEQVSPPEPPRPNIVCSNNTNPEPVFLNWELTVSPDGPIESGQPFRATLGGVAVFDEAFWDAASAYVRVETLDLVDLNATVHVRSGTVRQTPSQDDVTLEPDPARYRYECDFDRSPCDPANDVLEGLPGLRANTDCQPEGPTNPCGRFIRVPIHHDCDPGGICLSRGKSEQCETRGFCITGGIEIQLEEKAGHYTATTDETKVLFGWDDQSTGATLAKEGPNVGTWILPSIYHENDPLGLAGYQEEQGPISVRATLSGAAGALECTMAVSCDDPDFALDCPENLTTRALDEALIWFPIQPEAP